MKKLKSLVILLLICPILISCEKEDDEGNNNNNNQADPALTENRWKYPGTWEDYCDTITQTISGNEYLSFTTDHMVIYELELKGNTYGCEGDEETIGTWEKVNNEYYYYEGGDTAMIHIDPDGNQICLHSGGTPDCLSKE